MIHSVTCVNKQLSTHLPELSVGLVWGRLCIETFIASYDLGVCTLGFHPADDILVIDYNHTFPQCRRVVSNE